MAVSVVVVVVAPFLGLAYIASKWAGRVSVFFPFSSFFGSCCIFFLLASFLSPTLPLTEGKRRPMPKTSTQTEGQVVGKSAEEEATLGGAWARMDINRSKWIKVDRRQHCERGNKNKVFLLPVHCCCSFLVIWRK